MLAGNQQEEAIMTINVLKIAQRAALATLFVSGAAFAQTGSHEYVTVTPKQENVWGARIDVPNQTCGRDLRKQHAGGRDG